MTPVFLSKLDSRATVGLVSIFFTTMLAIAPLLFAGEPGTNAAKGGVFILDDSDPEYEGKDTYSDSLSLIDNSGKVVFRVSGLNGCQSIGSNRLIVNDANRGWVWVLEIVAHRIRKYDRSGTQLLALNDMDASAAAVDPETGNLWVLSSKGIGDGQTVVFDSNGKRLATHQVNGWDIAYDKKDQAFWIAGPKLSKISVATGVVSLSKSITAWCSSSLAVDPITGTAWVAVRDHPDVAGSKNELLAFNNDGELAFSIPLADKDPFHVSVDPKTGNAWVTIMRQSVQRYSPDGKLRSEYKLKALTCEADPATGGVWVVTPHETLRLNMDGATEVRVEHKAKTSQAWIAAH